MQRHARSWPAILALLAGCTPSQPLRLPPEAAQAAAILLATEPAGESPLYASESTALPPLTGDYDGVALLLYDTPLDALGLQAGLVPLAAAGESSRALPPPSASFLFEPAKGDGFSAASALPEWLTRRRLADRVRLTPQACVEAGGCYRDRDQLYASNCELPCSVTLTPLEAPMPVAFGPCPSGWISRMSGDHQRCEPPARVAGGCPRGQVQFVGDSACRPLGPDCPPGGFREPRVEGRLYYVNAQAAPNGDGTRGTPLDSLSAALTRAGAGDGVTLSAHSYPSNGLRLKDGVNLFGACSAATGTRLVSSSTFALVIAGSSTVSGLSIEGGSSGGISIDGAGVLALVGVELVGAGVGQAIRARGALFAHEVKSWGFDSFVAQDLSAPALALGQVTASGHAHDAVILRGPGSVSIEGLSLLDGQHHGVSMAEGRAGAQLSIRSSRFERHGGSTIYVAGGVDVVLHDLYVRDTVDLAGPHGGVERGSAYFQSQGTLEAMRMDLAAQSFAALWIQSADAEVQDVWTEQVGAGGGLRFEDSRGRVERFRSLGAGVGVLVHGNRVVLLDLDIEGGEIGLSTGVTGTVEVVRAHIHGVSLLGVAPSRSALFLRDTRIQGGLQNIRAFTGTITAERIQLLDPLHTDDPGTAIGVLIEPEAQFNATQFEVSGCERSGFAFNGDGYEISDGIFRRNGYGVVVQELDITRLSQRIWYHDNGVPILSIH